MTSDRTSVSQTSLSRANVPRPSDDDLRGVTATPEPSPAAGGQPDKSKEPTMAITTPQSRFEHAGSANGGDAVPVRADWRDPRYQAFSLLRLAFTVAPIAFGLDKFFNVLVHWPTYLAPWINDIAPGSGQDFMYFVGAVEIAAGLIVAFAPAIGAPIVALWLGGIIVNLLTNNPPEYYDIALRDFGLMLGALTLTRLAWVFARKGLPIRDGAAERRLRPRRAAL